ncbi:MAG: DUF4411 family protein [Desulfarculus sp.]|jgi:hypothetical protein|nr:MAG: DUF4411 family protein [Desulfarculus sp.]
MEDLFFILDSNVFIEAAQRYYAFDIAPGFWESLIVHSESGQVKSIDKVKGELERGKDQLAAWAKGDFSHAFVSTDEEDVIKSYGEVMKWVQSQAQFTDAAKADFASGADGWLVAYVMTRGGVLVTHEIPSPDVKRKVPIPNVCVAFDINFRNTFEMLRFLKVRFS